MGSPNGEVTDARHVGVPRGPLLGARPATSPKRFCLTPEVVTDKVVWTFWIFCLARCRTRSIVRFAYSGGRTKGHRS